MKTIILLVIIFTITFGAIIYGAKPYAKVHLGPLSEPHMVHRIGKYIRASSFPDGVS